MRAIVLVDHGSRRAEANALLHAVADLVVQSSSDPIIVAPAHMELAEPTIAQAFAACANRGATTIAVVPYMLAPGRHVTTDIPALAAEASQAHPTIPYHVTPPLGLHTSIAQIVLERAAQPA